MAAILLVGPDKDRAAGLASLLREDGHAVVWHRRVDDWRAREREMTPEVVVAPVEPPDELLAGAGAAVRGFPAPILLVQGEGTFQREPFLHHRLVDRVSSPFAREELLARVDALCRARRVILRRDAVGDEARADPVAPAGLRARMAALFGPRMPAVEKPTGPYLEVAARIAEWGDRRDAFEPGHQERVTSFCAMIAEGLGLGHEETTALLRAAMLHDIGKVGMPVEILHQNGPLDESQVRLLKTHPRRGAALLRALDPDDVVARTVLYHHECPNGSGYYGRGEDGTPRAARALAVAEVYDAMTTSRVTRTLGRDAALAALQDLKGETLDRDCVEALADVLRPRPDVIPLVARR